MKKVVQIVSVLAIAQSSTCIAESTSARGRGNSPNPLGVGVLPTIVPNPGDFNFTSSDTTELKRDLLSRIGKVQDSDRDYLDQVIQMAISATNKYNTLLITGKFKQLSDRSANGAPVDYEDFLTVINEVRGAKAELQTKLDLLTAAAHALPSDATINDEKSPQKVPAPRNIDFSELFKRVDVKLAAAEAQANRYPFTIKHMSGSIAYINQVDANMGVALNPVFEFPILNPVEIETLIAEASQLSIPPSSLDDLAGSYLSQLKQLISQFYYDYGKAEAYRFQDKAFAEKRAEQLARIVNGFWGLSYLRKVNGGRTGTILPKPYEKKALNLDKFTVLMSSLTEFREESSPSQINDRDLAAASESVRNILITLDERSSKILSGDASVLARVNSLIAYMRGERPSAEALLLIMQLIAADIHEEQMLTLGDGLAGVKRFYESRWNATPADTAVTEARICAFDAIYNRENQRMDCYLGAEEGGIKSTFNKMNNEFVVFGAQLDQANDRRQKVQQAILAQSMSAKGASGGAKSRRGR
jgi:hypothetical protein